MNEEYHDKHTDIVEEDKLEKCYYQHCIQGRNKDGDTKGELEWCTLSDNPCLLMTGDTCEEYNSQREE